ncbi:MAG: DinB family protein [Terriglobales bacterium]
MPTLLLALTMTVAAQQPSASKADAASQTDEPEANPARPTVSTPATLVPAGYFQFESGFLAAWHSPEFSSQASINEVVKISVSPRIEFLASATPFAHSDVAPANAAGDVSLGMQGVVHHGEGARPTLAVSYFGRVYSGPAPNLDIGSARNTVILLASADVMGFHYDTNYLFSEVIDDRAIHRAQFGQTLSVSPAVRAGRRNLAFHAAVSAQPRGRNSMGTQLHGEEEPGIRYGIQPRTDEHVDAMGGVRRVHLPAAQEAVSLTGTTTGMGKEVRFRDKPMEITSIESFLPYYKNIRERTMRVARVIPPAMIEWTYAPGKFTLGDLLRHIATIERHLWVEILQGKPNRYRGCGRELADGYQNVIAYVERLHQESIEIISLLTPEDLQKKSITPDGSRISTWKVLRLMVEHEIHHRGEIYIYLGMLGVKTPPLYGMTSEQVMDRAAKA